MAILKAGEFDLDALLKARSRKATSGGKTVLEAINEDYPEIGQLRVGQTARIDVPKVDGKPAIRKTVMSITAKLNNLTPKGGEWAGKVFKVISDGEQYVYVQRFKNLAEDQIVERKRGGGGGRKKKNTLETAMAAAKHHLTGNNEATPSEAATEVVEGGSATVGGEGIKITEHA